MSEANEYKVTWLERRWNMRLEFERGKRRTESARRLGGRGKCLKRKWGLIKARVEPKGRSFFSRSNVNNNN